MGKALTFPPLTFNVGVTTVSHHTLRGGSGLSYRKHLDLIPLLTSRTTRWHYWRKFIGNYLCSLQCVNIFYKYFLYLRRVYIIEERIIQTFVYCVYDNTDKREWLKFSLLRRFLNSGGVLFNNFDLSTLFGCWSSASIRRIACPFDYTAVAVIGKVGIP